jgi:transcriptional regulator with XRE-family HTH domain
LITLAEVGRRLKGLRLALKISADSAARSAGFSRALLYRYESGDVVKLDVIERLAQLYGTSTAILLGLDHEYIINGVLFFERLEKLEQEAEHITTVFGPLAYVLSTETYDEALMLSLSRDNSADALTPAELQRLQRILRRRKVSLRERKPGFVNIIPLSEIQTYVQAGLSAASDLNAAERAAQRRYTLKEIENLCNLIEKPPMGVQIALTPRPLPTAGFQVLRLKSRRLLVTSPFRLGEPVNLRYGIATISGDEQALRLHESLIARLWDSALTGGRAVDAIAKLTKA